MIITSSLWYGVRDFLSFISRCRFSDDIISTPVMRLVSNSNASSENFTDEEPSVSTFFCLRTSIDALRQKLFKYSVQIIHFPVHSGNSPIILKKLNSKAETDHHIRSNLNEELYKRERNSKIHLFLSINIMIKLRTDLQLSLSGCRLTVHGVSQLVW